MTKKEKKLLKRKMRNVTYFKILKNDLLILELINNKFYF